ncbi:MAG TPA: metalloregulator ArsR/SmtB family transcription factor [Candidatus Izemoplasmatales bacterium]|nr:metalloregulator ArsR/SmtB family transcription factor [Candidatus Izemoplasmatales bacterium]
MDQDKALMFKALSDVNRLTILELLAKGETCGCTLIDKLPISQPTMTYHLNFLTNSGLIKAYKDGIWKKHHVDRSKIDELIQFLVELKSLEGTCKHDQGNI